MSVTNYLVVEVGSLESDELDSVAYIYLRHILLARFDNFNSIAKGKYSMVYNKFEAGMNKVINVCKNRGMISMAKTIIKIALKDKDIGLAQAVELMQLIGCSDKEINKLKNIRSSKKEHDSSSHPTKWKYNLYFLNPMKDEQICVECNNSIPKGGPACQRKNGEWLHVVCIKNGEDNDNPFLQKWFDEANAKIARYN